MSASYVQVPVGGGRLRNAWRRAHAPVAGVPRWARIAAYAVPLAVLPSGLWRLASLFVETDGGGGAGGGGGDGDLPSWLPGPLYMVLLSIVSELLAFTAVGLIAAWGEVFPRWVPWLRGRRVPVVATTVVGGLAAVVLTVLWTVFSLVTEVAGTTITGEPSPADYPGNVGGWFSVVYYVSYVPLMLWGPLLGAVVAAYWKRRRREGREGGGAVRRGPTPADRK